MRIWLGLFLRPNVVKYYIYLVNLIFVFDNEIYLKNFILKICT